MRIHCPSRNDTAGLRRLWKHSFPDDDPFLDRFFSIAYSPSRCLCVSEGEQILAALYWFDASCCGKPLAYLYAVATDPARRKQGLCRRLMAETKQRLQQAGIAGLLLVPESQALAHMYENMGFSCCTAIHEFSCTAGTVPVPVRKIGLPEYEALRRRFLPPNGVLQEGETLALLASELDFYTGSDFLAAAAIDEGGLRCVELLGSAASAPGLLRALGCGSGSFRTPGAGHPFAYYCPLSSACPRPAYFGLALDSY